MKKILYGMVVIDFIMMVLNIAEIIHESFFRDIYPTIQIKEELTYFFWISLLLTLFLIMLILLLKGKKGNYIFFITGIFLLLIVSNFYFGLRYYKIVKPYPFDEVQNQDYLSSEYFRGISLDELMNDINSDNEILIYIGREDCKQCKEFEKEFECILEDYSTEIPTYYTTQDREGNRRDELYSVLEQYNIENVPIVILVKNAEVIKRWNNPIEDLDGIKDYL